MAPATLKQALTLAANTQYTGSVYARTDMTLLVAPSAFSTSPWFVAPSSTITFATSSLTNPIDGASDVLLATFPSTRAAIAQPFSVSFTQYTMSVWAQGTASGGSFFLGYYDGSNPISQVSPRFTPSAGQWLQYSLTFSASSSDPGPSMVIVNDQTDSGTAYAGTIAFYGAAVYSTANTATFFLAYSKDGTAITSSSNAFNPPTNAWQRYSYTWTTGAADSKPTFMIDNAQTTTGTSFTGTLSFRAAQVELGTLGPFSGGGSVSRPTAANITIANPGTGVTIAVPTYNTGEQVVSIAIATAPTHGTATISQTSIVYSGTTGDTFTYTVTNSGGTSLPGTVTVSPPQVNGLQILLCMYSPPNTSISTNPVGIFTSDLTGRPLDATLDYVDQRDFNHWVNGQSGGGSWAAANSPICYNTYMCWQPDGWHGFSTANIPSGLVFDLATAASGGYNHYYQQMGDGMATSTAKIYVLNINNEFNFFGDSNNTTWPWDMATFNINNPGDANVTNYILAQRNLISTIRTSYTSRGLTPPKIGWKTNIGHLDPTIVYPGDAYIDILVMDKYAAVGFSGTSDADCWTNSLSGGGPYAGNTVQGYSQGWGLTTMAAFGTAHGKPMGFDEWGWGTHVPGGTQSSGYVTSFLTWCQNNNVVYHSQWEGTDLAGNQDDFSLTNNSLAKAVYNQFYANTTYGGNYFHHFV